MGGLVSVLTAIIALKGGSDTGIAMPGLFLAFFALVTALTVTRTPVRSALVFGATTLPGHLIVHAWLLGITAPGYVLLSMAVALHAAAFVYLGARLRARVRNVWLVGLCAGLLLGATDVFRARLFFGGYPWYLTGSGLIDVGFARAMAAHVGMLGVNTVACVFMGVLAAWVARDWQGGAQRSDPRRARRFWGGFALCSAMAVLLVSISPRVSVATAPLRPDGAPVAVIQTNVAQSNKQSASLDERIGQFNDAARMTILAAQRTPALLVWPETMFPGSALNDGAVEALRDSGASYFEATADLRDALVAMQSRLGIPLLVGAMALESPRIVPDEEDDRYVRLRHDGAFNSVFLVENGAVDAARYDKMHLTPFGEVMPGISRWDWLERQLLALGAPGMSFDLEAGRVPHRFDVEGLRVATPICFEATVAHVCRRLVFERGERKADLIVNATNDGWFGPSRAGRLAHLTLSRWRAAELATPVLRAANTGVSVLIDETGRVVLDDWFESFVPENGDEPATLRREGGTLAARDRVAGVLFTRVAPGMRTTLYARTGDVVGWSAFFAGVVLAAWGVWPRKNRDASNPVPRADA